MEIIKTNSYNNDNNNSYKMDMEKIAQNEHLDDSDNNLKKFKKNKYKSLRSQIIPKKMGTSIIKMLPAVMLGLILTLLDALTYGIIIFPKSEYLPSTYVQAGISLFLVSTLVSQIFFSVGFSGFHGTLCGMMVEVIPFLHTISETIIQEVDKNKPNEIIATIMFVYAFSSIFMAILFFLIGFLKLGKILSYFPEHILKACIGGIGVFLLQTAIEIITGYSFQINLDYIKNIFTDQTVVVWLFSLFLAILIKLIQKRFRSELITPFSFLIIPIIFYIVVFIGRIDLDRLRNKGWLFNFESNQEEEKIPFYVYFTYISFKDIRWSIIPYVLSPILASAVLGMINVSINVPSFSITSDVEVDINKEFRNHGYSNLLSGCFFSLPNYIIYSGSTMFFKCGGRSNFAGIILAFGMLLLLFVGNSFIAYVPTIIIGSLLFILGIDLSKIALYDLYFNVNKLEYFTVVLIIISMNIWGFTEGIFIGIVLAFIFFGITISKKHVINLEQYGNELPSTVYYLKNDRKYLNKMARQIKVIYLQGFIFFGSFQQINNRLNQILNYDENIKYIIMDFKLVNGIDYSAADKFNKLKYKLIKKRIYFIVCNIQSRKPLERVKFFDIDEDKKIFEEYFMSFRNYDEAIERCENQILSNNPNIKKEQIENNKLEPDISEKDDKRTIMNLLTRALSNENYFIERNEFKIFADYFDKIEFATNNIIWQPEMPSKDNKLYIMESGKAVLYSITESQNADSIERNELEIGKIIQFSIIGENDFFLHIKHTTKLVTQERSVLWYIDYEKYDQFTNEYPQLALKLIQLILASSTSTTIEKTFRKSFISNFY